MLPTQSHDEKTTVPAGGAEGGIRIPRRPDHDDVDATVESLGAPQVSLP
jgi:hypothetical protein